MAYADVSERRVYYERHGDFDAPGARPLVLLMGMAGSCAGWLPLQVPAFSREHPVLIFDNRGVGKSEDPGGAFTTTDLARDTRDLFDVLGIARADVLGTSMGGMAAQEFALHWPARIDRLVLVGTYARPDTKRRMLLEHWIELARHAMPRDAMIRDRLLWTLHEDTLEQSDLIEAMIDFFVKEGIPFTGDLFARQCRACIEHDALERLGEIEHETLVLCGQHDLLTPPHFHRELAERIGGSRLVTLSEGGHVIMVEAAERFNQIVLQFLNQER